MAPAEQDDDGILFVGIVTGPDESQQRWGDVAMGLARRVSEQYRSEPLTSPFALQVHFLARGRFVEADFEGVRVGRFPRRHNLLTVLAALNETVPDDPVAEVIGLLHEAVDAACAYAGKKKIADDLPSLRRTVEKLADAGPAPLRKRRAPIRPIWADDEPGEGPFLRMTVSSGEVEAEPSEGLLEIYLDDFSSGQSRS